MTDNHVVLALYGTLRSGGRLHKAYGVDAAVPCGKGTVRGYILVVCGGEWFPRAFRCADEHVVVEVYAMDPVTAGRISVMEADAGYSVEVCPVTFDDGRTVDAMMFVCEGDRSGCREVPGGDWMA